MRLRAALPWLCLSLLAEEVSGGADRQVQRLTLYQAGPAAVLETRPLKLAEGKSTLRVEGLPEGFHPSSVTLFPGKGVTVLALETRVFPREPHSFLQPGQSVLVVRGDQREPAVVITRPSDGERVLQFGDRVELLNPLDASRLVLPGLPPGVEVRPSVRFRLHADHPGARTTELSYLCSGPSWNPEYTVTFDRGCTRLDLTAWARLSNPTEMDFNQVPLDLVAGDLPESLAEGRAFEQGVPPVSRFAYAPRSLSVDLCADSVSQQPLGEHHLFTLPEPVTLPARGALQVPFLQARGIPARRDYVLIATAPDPEEASIEPCDRPVYAELVFANRADQGLGRMLPSGRVRLFQPDDAGHPRYLGASTFEPSVEGREVRLGLGVVAELGAQVRQTEHTVLPQDRRKGSLEVRAYAVVLSNARAQAEQVQVRCPVPGDWEVLACSHDWTKGQAHRLDARVTVPAKGQTTLTYRVRVRR